MTKQIQDAYIVAATRTPVGKAPKGMFRNTRPDDMLAHVLRSVVAQAPAQLLAGVHVGVDEPRHQDFAVAVDGLIVFSRRRFAAVNGQNTVVLYDNAAPGINAHVRVHGDHVGVFQQDFQTESLHIRTFWK